MKVMSIGDRRSVMGGGRSGNLKLQVRDFKGVLCRWGGKTVENGWLLVLGCTTPCWSKVLMRGGGRRCGVGFEPVTDRRSGLGGSAFRESHIADLTRRDAAGTRRRGRPRYGQPSTVCVVSGRKNRGLR